MNATAWLRRLLVGRQPEPPQHNRLAGGGFQTIIDGSMVTWPAARYQGAMSIPGAWRCALLLSDLLGGVPWDAYRDRPGGRSELLSPAPALLEQPAPPDTRMTTFSSLALDLVYHGNAVALIAARNAEGWPTAMLPVPAQQVGVRRVPDASSPVVPPGGIEYSYYSQRFAVDDVVHIKGPCEPGALRGMGVLEQHLDGALSLAQQQSQQAGSISQHGVPTGVLSSDNPDLTGPEAAELKTKWLESQQQRTVAVLNATTHFQPLAWNPEELQLVEARKYSLHEMALIFGVPLSVLGVETSNRTYRNDESEGINLLKFSLGGHLARFEQTLTQHHPRGVRVKANLDSILRADTLTRYQAHAVALTNGFLTVDEVRQLEDRQPLPAAATPPAPIPPAADTGSTDENTPEGDSSDATDD